VSRVTTGKIKLTLQPLDLAKVVSEALANLRSAGQLEDHELRLQTQSVWVEADQARLEQIVYNLVGNAVKFTPPGGCIRVTVSPENQVSKLVVADTGSGLEPDLAPRIFDLFVQGEQTLDRSTSGLGIGLTLVNHLTELHGGRVEASSPGVGRGTAVTVTLPAIETPSAAVADALARKPRGNGSRILLIDDNDDARETLRNALELYGYRVTDAADGVAGIEMARRVDCPIAVVDIGLPGIDGYQVARELRALPGGDSLILIAVSGYGQADTRRRAQEAGFDEFITKPVAPDALATVISSLSGA
jgi:CheY-like chemotaxis protein